MKRRNFLKHTIPAAAGVPILLNGLSLQAMETDGILHTLLNPNVETDHVLVLIYLGGGNDGLATVYPLNQYQNLVSARSNVLVQENRLLRLNGRNDIALHPAMGKMQTMYNESKLQIIQSVGYPSPNFSHFRSTDIWTSASNTDEVLDTGWMGRYLAHEYPGFPLNYPNANDPHPLAIQIGSNLPLLFQGPLAQMSMNVSNPDIFGKWPSGISDPANTAARAKELNFIRTTSRQSKTYADELLKAFLGGTNAYNAYPEGGNYLSATLKAVARVIKGGLKTRVFLVGLNGFDTHSDQVEQGNTTAGAHSTLLNYLSEAIFAFQKDLELMNLDKRVLGMTFSEFGRRIKSNASIGTDHGTSSPLFVFGSNVQSGVLGTNPIIPASVTDADNLAMQYDFRSVYASVLKDWFCLQDSSVDNILLRNFQRLPIVKDSCATTSLNEIDKLQDLLQIEISSNPMVERCSIRYNSLGGPTLVQLFDPLGRMVKTLVNKKVEQGTYNLTLENDNYAPGNYYIRLQNGSLQKTALLIILA